MRHDLVLLPGRSCRCGGSSDAERADDREIVLRELYPMKSDLYDARASSRASTSDDASATASAQTARRSRRARELRDFVSDRQAQVGAAAAAVGAVFQRQRAAVRFGDLPAEHQADARSARLGREERHEQVRRVRQPRSFIVDPQLEAAALALPADGDAAAGLQRGIRRRCAPD